MVFSDPRIISVDTIGNFQEVIRAQRLNTKEEADALVEYINNLVKSGQNKFEVKMNLGGDMMLPGGYISAANAPIDDQFLTSLNDDTIELTFPGTGYYSLTEEATVIERCVDLNSTIDVTTMFVPVK